MGEPIRIPPWLRSGPAEPLRGAGSPNRDPRTVYLYGLLDPGTDELRYIGKSVRPRSRFRDHLSERSECHRGRWIRSLRRRGLAPRMVILATLHGAWPWQEAERHIIAAARAAGYRLTNGTSGGDGVPDLDTSARERIRQAWVGRTWDSSRTPKAGERRTAPKKLADVDLEAIRGKVAATIERAKADDPKVLKKRIAELEKELSKKPTAAEPRVEAVEVPVLDDLARAGLAELGQQMGDLGMRLAEASQRFEELRVQVARSDVSRPGQLVSRPDGLHRDRKREAAYVGSLPKTAAASVRVTKMSAPRSSRARSGDDSVTLKRGAREMLRALASMHPRRLSRHQLATLAGMSPGSGTYSTYLGHLRAAGFMLEEGSELGVSAEGLAYLGGDVPPAPTSAAELVDRFKARLKAGARRMLDELVIAYPRAMTRAELAERVEMAPSSGTFSTYLGHLRRNGLLDEERGSLRASPTLFAGGGR